jgi:hypothetical protein
MGAEFQFMTYDDTDWSSGVSNSWFGSLSLSWFAGGKLYKAFKTLDVVKPAKSWSDVERSFEATDKKFDVWQFWGHGTPGAVYVDGVALTRNALQEDHPLHGVLAALKKRLHKNSLVWFRTCSTFHGEAGKLFAKELSEFLNCRIAAHTFLIGPWQSGLHSLRPGEEPNWSDNEGKGKKGVIKMSGPFDPNTINCLQGYVPKGW